MNTNDSALPVEPRRVIAFANFFKRYMSISSVITAALPIPVTAFSLIPTYSAHTKILSTYTPLFCFLTLGFIFYIRHSLARLMFPEHLRMTAGYERPSGRIDLRHIGQQWMKRFVMFLPALLILASVGCIMYYHYLLEAGLKWMLPESGFVSAEEALQYLDLPYVPEGPLLMVLYLGIFVFAEASFILMAIKEYLQDLLELSEIELMRGPLL